MVYRLMGRLHALMLRSERGQGTVEYVGMILLIAGVICAVAAYGTNTFKGDGLGGKIAEQLTTAIDNVAGEAGGKK